MKAFFILSSLLGAAVATWEVASIDPLEFHELVRRDAAGLEVVSSVLYNISNNTIKLNDLLASFTTDKTLELNVASNDAVGAIIGGVAAVQPIANLTIADAIGITGILTQLVGVVNKTVTTTINQREALGGLAPVVLANLHAQYKATQNLNAAVGLKLPESLVSTSAALNQPIYDSLDLGIAAYSTTPVNMNKAIYSSDAASVFGSSWGTVAVASLAWATIGSMLL